jgi:CheY-like chemotaxis protein
VIAEAADGQEAVRLAAIHCPDVALLDVIPFSYTFQVY